MTDQERDSALWDPTDVGMAPGDDDLVEDAGMSDADVEVEVIATQIDGTRADLGETIDEIGRRLEPANVAREAGQTVRDATTRKVEYMTTGIQDTIDDVRRGDASGIVGTITRNPIPAAMVAVGLGLLFMNRGAQSSRNGNGWSRGYGTSYGTGYDPRYAYGTGDWQRWPDQASPLDRASSRVSAARDDAGAAVGDLADQASSRAQEMGDTVNQRLQAMGDSVSETAMQVQDQAGTAMRRGTSEARRAFEENPLAFGVAAVAAGAAIGLLAPSTDAERRTLGPARDRFVEQAQQQVNEALDTMDQGSASSSTGGGSASTRSAGTRSPSARSTGSSARKRSTSASPAGADATS